MATTTKTKATKERIRQQYESHKRNHDIISLLVPKGRKVVYQQMAKDKGMSTIGMIVMLLENELKKMYGDKYEL